MLPPLAITRRYVVYPGEEAEVIDGHLRRLDAELLVQLALRRAAHSLYRLLQTRASLSRDTQRMRAASVCPHVGESDLLGCALLQEQSVLGVEKEDREGAVQQSLIDVFHQMACVCQQRTESVARMGRVSHATPPLLTVLLSRTADGDVILVQHDAHFVHQPYLLLVVAVKRIVAGGGSVRAADYRCVDFGE